MERKLNNLTKYLSWIMLFVLLLVVVIYEKNNNSLRKDNKRLVQNQKALSKDIKVWRDKDSCSVAEIQTLKLTKSEFATMYEQQALEVLDLKIKLKRLQSYSQTSIGSTYYITDTIFDSIIIRENNIDTLQCMGYNDNYISFNGCIENSNFSGHIQTYDTIISIIHIKPKKFLWFKYGVKSVDNIVKSKNPYSTIESVKHIEIGK